MRNIVSFISFAFLVTSFFLSCERNFNQISQNSDPNDSTIIDNGDSIIIEYFPNEFGNKWVYAFYDSMLDETDTLRVTILNPFDTYDSTSYNYWQYALSSKIDTVRVKVVGDTAWIYPSFEDWFLFKFVFPLFVGSSWEYSGYYDIYVVQDKSDLTVPAGTFDEAYLIFRRAYLFNCQGEEKIWYVPKVGIVKRKYKEYHFGTMYENATYNLVNYSLY